MWRSTDMSSSDRNTGATATSLRELPQSVAPPRDLWPEIEARLAQDRVAGSASRRSLRPSRGQWFSLAAVVFALTVGIWLGRRTLPAGSPTSAGNASTVTGGGPAVLKAAFVSDPRYLQQRADLIRAVDAQMKELPPETQAKVAASLATIRKSMQDIQSALGRDPGNALLQVLL